MTHVRINESGIQHFFERSAVGGTGLRVLGRDARRIASLMVVKAKVNATSGEILQGRTGTLADSVQPIVRVGAHGGLEVGVGSTAPYADYLENGTPGHPIGPRGLSSEGKQLYLKSYPDHPANRKPLTFPQLKVDHPGITAKYWLRNAVRSVIPRGF